jgi:RNA polymerase sigma-70 factor (ECF subfamily)
MIFTCCHESISIDSQIALALKTLCGFSISEIAKAFLTTEENINKRLVRARQTLREKKILFEVPQGPALEKRLKGVLETIYLLFNEGYSASHGNDIIRYDLCEEAIRLAEIISQHPAIREKSEVCALLALMQLNASRFEARVDNEGNLLSLAEQDRSLWNKELVTKGIANLQASIKSHKISAYQLLAMISVQHCIASDFASTNWNSILSLYDNLVEIDSSPLILLNRAVAITKVKGPGEALVELDRLKDHPLIRNYHLFYLTTAEIDIELSRFSTAIANLERAFQLAAQSAQKKLIKKRIDFCKAKLLLV